MVDAASDWRRRKNEPAWQSTFECRANSAWKDRSAERKNDRHGRDDLCTTNKMNLNFPSFTLLVGQTTAVLPVHASVGSFERVRIDSLLPACSIDFGHQSHDALLPPFVTIFVEQDTNRDR